MGRKILSVLKKDWQLWIMILPAIVYIIIFCYGPMYGIQLAFRKYDFSKGLTGGDWVGFKYFIQYFESPMFWTTLRNTFIISFFTLICGFPAPILLALVVNSLRRVLSVGFEKVFLMQNDMNLPVSEVISTYVFNVGVQSGQFSFGSAVGLFNTVINFAFLMIANMVSKKAADISLM